MSGTNRFTDAAIEQVKHAIALDNQQNYQEAFTQYQQALETFMKAVKFEQLAPVRKQLEIKMLQYMDRAEQLKALLSSRTQPAAAPSTPTAGAAGATAAGTGAAGGRGSLCARGVGALEGHQRLAPGARLSRRSP